MSPVALPMLLVSSAMMLLKIRSLPSLAIGRWPSPLSSQLNDDGRRPTLVSMLLLPALLRQFRAAGAGAAAALRCASLIALILSRRFCSSSMRTVRNLITGSVTRRRRSSS